MEIKLEIKLSNSGEMMDISEVVSEGESVVFTAEGDDNWRMEVTPEEVIPVIDTDSAETCPVCGEPIDEIVPMTRIDETIDLDRVCVGHSEAEDRDCLLYFHQPE